MKGANKSIIEQEQNVPSIQLFSELSEEEMNRLNYDKICNFHKRGSVIYKEGNRLNGCFCISSGIVKVYKTGINGKEQIIRFAKKGDLIAYRSLLSKEVACSAAKVIDDAVLCQIPYKTLLFLIQSNWKFSKLMLQIMCRELRDSNDYITSLAQKSLRERLAEMLLLLKTDFELDSQNTLQISLKRIDLADSVGAAPESVIRVLSEFQHDKMIEMQGKKIKFIDIPGLHRVANM
jgi:CRP-like cAMP-binding protein